MKIRTFTEQGSKNIRKWSDIWQEYCNDFNKVPITLHGDVPQFQHWLRENYAPPEKLKEKNYNDY